MKLWNREDIAYMAALFEGEGCVQGNPLRAKIGMTDEDVLLGFAERAGVGAVSGPTAPSGLGRKPVYHYTVTGRKAYALLVAMYPLLCARRRGQVEKHVAPWLQKVRGRKIAAADAAAIKTQLASGGHGTARRLARHYGVSDGLICAIRQGRAWKEVMPDVQPS